MDRLAIVFFQNVRAGILRKTKTGFDFQYTENYVRQGTPISFNLPLQKEAFTSETLFPFFDNLTSEGWLRNIQTSQQKISDSDSFNLLLNNGEDLVGAVTIRSSEAADDS